MLYEKALKSNNIKMFMCQCSEGHTWEEFFYLYRLDNGKTLWMYADSGGSICPECGGQDMLDH